MFYSGCVAVEWQVNGGNKKVKILNLYWLRNRKNVPIIFHNKF